MNSTSSNFNFLFFSKKISLYISLFNDTIKEFSSALMVAFLLKPSFSKAVSPKNEPGSKYINNSYFTKVTTIIFESLLLSQ